MTRVAALRALHDEHAEVLWRYVVSLTGAAADADDVVQETLLRAWRHPGLLDEDVDQVRGWLFTVARHLVIDQARSARRRHEFSVADHADRPDRAQAERTDRILDAILLHDALDSLSAAHREVIVRAYYQGHSIHELADDLGIAEGTVKSRLHYGLRALRLAFEERGVTR